MAQVERSAGYEALAKGMIYDFKKEAGITSGHWTPHSIRCIFLMSNGFYLSSYDPSIKVMRSDKIACDLQNPENVRDSLAAMYSLGGSLSANVSNCESIVVVTGGICGINPGTFDFSNICQVIGYTDLRTKMSGSSKMSIPECVIVDGRALNSVCVQLRRSPIQALCAVISEGKQLKCAELEAKIRKQSSGGSVDFCRVKGDISWRPYTRQDKTNPDLDVMSFSVDDVSSRMGIMFPAGVCLLAAQQSGKFGNQQMVLFRQKALGADNKETDLPVVLTGLDLNAGNYPFDTNLKYRISTLYYFPYAAYSYYMQELDSTAGYYKIGDALSKEIQLLGVISALDSKHLPANKVWVKAISLYFVTLALKLELKDDTLATKYSGLIASLMRTRNFALLAGSEGLGVKLDGITKADFDNIPVIQRAIRAFALGTICLGCFSEYATYKKLSESNIAFRIEDATLSNNFKFKFPDKLTAVEKAVIARMCYDVYGIQPNDMLSPEKYFPKSVLSDDVSLDNIVNILVKMLKEGY